MSLAKLLPTPKSVCYIYNNTYSASFDGAKDAAYTAKYGQPQKMKEGRRREGGSRKGMGGKEGEGRE